MVVLTRQLQGNGRHVRPPALLFAESSRLRLVAEYVVAVRKSRRHLLSEELHQERRGEVHRQDLTHGKVTGAVSGGQA